MTHSNRPTPYDKHQSALSRIQTAVLLATVFEQHPQLRARAEAIRQCAENLYAHTLHPETSKRYACGTRMCPCCGGREWSDRRRYVEALPLLTANHPGSRAVAVTLTTRDVPVSGVRQRIKHMQGAFRKLWRRNPMRHAVAHLRGTEVTRADDGLAHPHTHSLIVMPDAQYAADLTGSLNQLWPDVGGSDCLISEATDLPTTDDLLGWGRYTAKGCVRVTDEMLNDPPFVHELALQLDGMRLFEQTRSISQWARRVAASCAASQAVKDHNASAT